MRKLRKYLSMPLHVFRILRAMILLWFLKKVTHPEVIPLIVYGRYVAHKNDVILVNTPKGKYLDIGEVVDVTFNPHEDYETVFVRLFRRPN